MATHSSHTLRTTASSRLVQQRSSVWRVAHLPDLDKATKSSSRSKHGRLLIHNITESKKRANFSYHIKRMRHARSRKPHCTHVDHISIVSSTSQKSAKSPWKYITPDKLKSADKLKPEHILLQVFRNLKSLGGVLLHLCTLEKKPEMQQYNP